MMNSKLNFDFQTTQAVIQKIGLVDGFSSRWAVIAPKESFWLKELRRIATIESIGSSTRIEGSTLTDAEVERLIKSVKITQFATRDEQEVVGYYEVLLLILEQWESIALTESNIQALHNQLMKHSDKDQHHKGRYKSLSNKVVANYPGGVQRTIFNTTEPHLTGKEMEAAVAWFNEATSSKSVHSLLAIGAFVYEFLSIHPFQDGNGRLSRLLTTLLMLRQGYGFVEFVSFENIIESRKQDYYRALISGQRNRGTEQEIIGEWMLFFLECAEELIRRLERKNQALQTIGNYLTERQRSIRAFIQEKQAVKMSEIDRAFPEVSIHSLRKDVQFLVNQSEIEQAGTFKSTIYIAKQPSQ
jgi:Fic family protein